MTHTFSQRLQYILTNTTNERELLHQIKILVYETEFEKTAAKDSKNISELLTSSLALLQQEKPFSNTIRTGFQNLDNEIGGFMQGELVVIGARPGMGKTQLLVNLTLNISQTQPVLYFTFDLSAFLLTHRFLSALSGVPMNKILEHQLYDEQKEKLQSLEKDFAKYQIFINDSYNHSISAFKAHCAKQIEEHNVKIIMVDYLQMMSSNKYRSSRELEISHITRELKNIAKENNVCVIATSQLSRAVESRGGSKQPQLSDLRESGAIEQDADKVLFLYRPEYYGLTEDENNNPTGGVADLIIAKNRNGRLGTAKLQTTAHFTNFIDFVGYKTDFEFSKNRLNEMEEPPF